MKGKKLLLALALSGVLACGATAMTACAGADGLKGDKGDQGIAGTPGSKGDKGDQGVSGTPGVGVEDVSMEIVNDITVLSASLSDGTVDEIGSFGKLNAPTVVLSSDSMANSDFANQAGVEVSEAVKAGNYDVVYKVSGNATRLTEAQSASWGNEAGLDGTIGAGAPVTDVVVVSVTLPSGTAADVTGITRKSELSKKTYKPDVLSSGVLTLTLNVANQKTDVIFDCADIGKQYKVTIDLTEMKTDATPAFVSLASAQLGGAEFASAVTVKRDGYKFKVGGTAAKFTEAQVTAFGVMSTSDYFCVLSFEYKDEATAAAFAKLNFTSVTNSEQKEISALETANGIEFVLAFTADNQDTVRSFTVTDVDGNTTTLEVDFSELELPDATV